MLELVLACVNLVLMYFWHAFDSILILSSLSSPPFVTFIGVVGLTPYSGVQPRWIVIKLTFSKGVSELTLFQVY